MKAHSTLDVIHMVPQAGARTGTAGRSAPSVAPQAQATVTRERLVVAFALAFAEQGYLAVNLNEVVGRLGLTKGAFYFHFRSKDDVAGEVARRHLERWKPMMEAAKSPEGDALETLVATVRTLCLSYRTDPVLRGGTRLLTERSVVQAELPRPFVAWIEAFTVLLRVGQERGQVAAEINAAAYSNFLVAFVYGALQVSGELSRRADLLGRLDPLWATLLPALEPA